MEEETASLTLVCTQACHRDSPMGSQHEPGEPINHTLEKKLRVSGEAHPTPHHLLGTWASRNPGACLILLHCVCFANMGSDLDAHNLLIQRSPGKSQEEGAKAMSGLQHKHVQVTQTWN